MAIIKCKMCGGSLELTEGSTVAQCEYCGTTQTVPAADNEKKLVLFERADRLRRQCEFDKASGVYETIVEDFPNEAEAYWGLVLCKFGIEYVDDPATGKKVPTCHRSSFDNVLADDNYQQALENTDEIAARVYRDEAKAIERLRKGIVEVSAKEDPYDIFICYKETAAAGGRTPDSVIAQDIYDALTARGYRVFFSRITLEDKLGIDYEPYIFAALNSAKLMLAVGTEYDHYHAVWVKNEWSRYLQLMAKDKDKHLIPCYRDVEPEDLPVPFQRLQGQDMGKIGAMQDLLRGVEKLLPRAQETSAVAATVAAGPNVASLLHRGNMALEDGNWDSADKFFEEVLNSDSKNGAAYLGKVLAQAKCVSLHTYVQQRLRGTEGAGIRTCQIDKDTQRHTAIIEKFVVFYYLPADKIRSLLEFNGTYGSQVVDRKRQLAEEKQRWIDNKLLTRAEQFADPALAEQIRAEKAALLDALTQRIKAAEEEEAKNAEQVRIKYAAHLDRTEALVQELNERARKQQADDLTTYKKVLEVSRNVDDLAMLKGTLRTKFQNDPEADELYKLCGRKIFTIEEEALAARSALLKRMGIIVAIVAAVIALLLLTINVIIPAIRYANAEKLMQHGEYDEAIVIFTDLGDYSDAPKQIVNCLNWIADDKYNAAVQLMQAGKYEEAIAIFESLDGHKDSAAQIEACNIGILDDKYDAAVELMQAGKYEDAIEAFTALEDYKDSANKKKEAAYTYALTLCDSENTDAAFGYFSIAEDFADAEMYRYFYFANNAFSDGNIKQAYDIYTTKLNYDLTIGNISVKDRIAFLEKHKELVEMCGSWTGTTNSTPAFSSFESTALQCTVSFDGDQPKISLKFSYYDSSKQTAEETIVLNETPKNHVFKQFTYTASAGNAAGKTATYSISFENGEYVVTCILYGAKNDYGGKYTYVTKYKPAF